MAGESVRRFATAGEAGAFWDSYSPEDFPAEFSEATVQFDRPLIKCGLTVKLSEETIGQLRDLARAQGDWPLHAGPDVDPRTLAGATAAFVKWPLTMFGRRPSAPASVDHRADSGR